MKKTKMLEEIQMTPGLVDGVIGCVLFLTNLKTLPALETQPNVKLLVGMFAILKLELGNIPWF